MIRDLAEERVDGSGFEDFSASSLWAIIGRRLCLIGLFKVLDLAEETVDGSSFDDFSASSMLVIIGRQDGVMSN